MLELQKTNIMREKDKAGKMGRVNSPHGEENRPFSPDIWWHKSQVHLLSLSFSSNKIQLHVMHLLL